MDPVPSALHSEATRLHREGRLAEAESKYRDAYAETKFAATAVGLGQLLLLGTSPTDLRDRAGRLAEARALVRSAVADAALLTPRPAAVVLTRCGYFYLLDSGALRVAGSDVGHGGSTPDSECLRSAVSVLEQAVELDGCAALAWQNLSKAYRFVDRLDDAARASGRALDALRSAGKGVPAPVHYEHAKALRRVRRYADAAVALCDALDADPGHQLASFCLRVTRAACEAPGGSPLLPQVAERVARCLSGGSDSAAAGPVIPLDYVRLLFDGYASKFESHLTEQLEYRTPSALLTLALTHAGVHGASAAPSRRHWARCADLGCGTGLVGALVRSHVGFLAGVDLSPGMITEVERTRPGVYDELAVGDVEAWLRGRPAARPTGEPSSSAPSDHSDKFDLIFCADVLVYIPELRSLFQAVAASLEMAPAATGRESAIASAHTATSSDAAAPAVATASGTLSPSPYCAVSKGPGPSQTLSQAQTQLTVAASTPGLFLCSTEADTSFELEADCLAANTSVDAGKSESGASDYLDAQAGPGYRLLASGRCCHRRRYVISAAADAGLALVHVERRPIRKNAGLDIIGDLFVFKKSTMPLAPPL